jgi:transcriptional regulator with XRE-family HTH domain
MSPKAYKELRESLGSQAYLADILGVAISTIERRENGKVPISHEASMAINMIVLGFPITQPVRMGRRTMYLPDEKPPRKLSKRTTDLAAARTLLLSQLAQEAKHALLGSPTRKPSKRTAKISTK